MEDQTTLTQIRTSISKVYTTQDDHEGNTNETRNEYQTPAQCVPFINPYSKKKTPTVTPQKTTTHTKPKQRLPTDTTHLKNPPSYSLTSLTQGQKNKAPSRELEEIVHNTEQKMDAAMEEFLWKGDKETVDRHEGNKEHSLVIEGIGSPFGATNKAALNALNKYMDKLGDKYRHIIKEYEDMKSGHEQTFRQALQDIARRYKQQAWVNIKHIITTQSSKAEQNFKAQLQVISRPQTNKFTRQVLSQLKADTIIYTHKLEKEYLDRQEEMISDLDHYHSKASEILEEAMDDFYIHTVPFTIPLKLTEYIDQHLEKRVTELVNNKFNEIFEKRMT
jgi:hypothetical protein